MQDRYGRRPKYILLRIETPEGVVTALYRDTPIVVNTPAAHNPKRHERLIAERILSCVMVGDDGELLTGGLIAEVDFTVSVGKLLEKKGA